MEFGVTLPFMAEVGYYQKDKNQPSLNYSLPYNSAMFQVVSQVLRFNIWIDPKTRREQTYLLAEFHIILRNTLCGN